METEVSADDTVPHRRCGYVALSIFKYFPHDGAPRDMFQIAEELTARGHRVVIFCGVWEGEPPRGCEVRRLDCRAWSNHGRAKKFAARLRSEFRKDPPLLHAAFNRLPGADLYFAADCPFIAAARRQFPILRYILPRYRVFEAMERAVFAKNSSTRIFCVTPRQQEAYQREYGTPPERMFLLPPGIPADRKRPADPEPLRRAKRAELGLEEEEIALLSVGSGFRAKGVDRSIRALAELPDGLREKVRLFIAGCGTSAPFRELARRLGVEEQVRFLGGRDDIPALLLSADLLLHPARNEAAGNVLLESLAAGLPVLASGNCGFAPYVAEAGSLVLEEPFRQQELNRTLLLTLSVPGRIEELAREAIAYSASADLYRRASAAAEIMEGVLHEKM